LQHVMLWILVHAGALCYCVVRREGVAMQTRLPVIDTDINVIETKRTWNYRDERPYTGTCHMAGDKHQYANVLRVRQ
jgi:hypothetical protein